MKDILSQSLKGTRVLDCSTLFPGPSIAQKLQKLGASVTKIEHPTKVDGAKAMGSTFYRQLNQGKKILKLDFKSDQNRFHSELINADILIEAFRDSTRRKLGLDFKTLKKINPKIIVVSLYGYSPRGKWKNRAGHDLNFQALSGFLSAQGTQSALPLADLITVQKAVSDVMAALYLRSKKSKAIHVEISFYKTLVDSQKLFAIEGKHQNEKQKPGHNLFGGKYPCYRVYTCQDKQLVAVGAFEKKFWVKTCEILSLPEFIHDGYAQGARAKVVIARVERVFRSKKWNFWKKHFEKANCCVEPVLDYSEVFE